MSTAFLSSANRVGLASPDRTINNQPNKVFHADRCAACELVVRKQFINESGKQSRKDSVQRNNVPYLRKRIRFASLCFNFFFRQSYPVPGFQGRLHRSNSYGNSIPEQFVIGLVGVCIWLRGVAGFYPNSPLRFLTRHSSGLGDTAVIRVNGSTQLKVAKPSPLSLVR